MKRAEQALTLIKPLLLLAAAAACSDLPDSPGLPTAGGESTPSFSVDGRSPRDVPAVRIGLPPAARPWDGDLAVLEQVVASGGGYAVVAFKEPGSARALVTGNRGAVTAGTVRAGLQLLERNGVEVLELLDAMGAARVRMSPQAAAAVAGHPLVDFVEPRQYLSLQAQTTPWGITMVGAPAFWTATGVTGAGAKVQIIDTGHQQNHVDLPAVPAANCAGAYGGCDDGGSWHGTHVLGIVAARNNTAGVVGVAPGIGNADVFVYGACDSAGGGCPNDVVAAGINASIGKAHVINLSLGGSFSDPAMATAVANAWSNGLVIVAAAGNNLGNSLEYPAAYPNVIGVSGVNNDKSFAGFGTTGCSGWSNSGAHVDLAAPFSANSTIGLNGYATLCGTSMATPHVTGVAALLKSQNPSWTNQQIVDHLFATAEDRGAAGWDSYYGHGIVALDGPKTPCPNISGPASISAAGTFTWQANAACGNGTYTYRWRYRVQGTTTWTLVGTSPSYSRAVGVSDPDFQLKVTAISAGLSGSDTHLVDVGAPPPPPLNVAINGPTTMMPAQVDEWTAAVTGGTPPYTYLWQYRIHGATTWTDVGTGTTYSRRAGSADFDLRVTVTDSHGTIDSDTHFIDVSCGGIPCP